MKQRFLLFLLCACPGILSAQSTELSVQLSSGFFSYAGKSAASTSSIYTDDRAGYFSVRNVFGAKGTWSYGIQAQGQRVTKRNFLWGFRLGYDRLGAKSHINLNWSPSGFGPSDGTVRLYNHVVQANPYLGYRIPIKKFLVDFTAGLNVGSIRSSDYKVKMEESFRRNVDGKAENRYINTKWDFGPVAGVAIKFNRFSVAATYIYGLINYQRMMDGANPEVYSRYLRLGVGYRIR